MSNTCPKCNIDLKLKLMKTVSLSNNEFSIKAIGKRIPVCPNCGALLENNPHQFDAKIQTYLVAPFGIFCFSLFFNEKRLMYLSIFLFVVGIVYVYRNITSTEYKKWNVWRLYDE